LSSFTTYIHAEKRIKSIALNVSAAYQSDHVIALATVRKSIALNASAACRSNYVIALASIRKIDIQSRNANNELYYAS